MRFGYDPRKEPESRLYVRRLPSFQRIHLRGKAPRNATARGIFKAEYGDVLQGQRERESAPASDTRPATHIFDGKHAALSTSTFQLCDITDITIVPLIRAEGDSNLRAEPDVRAQAHTDYHRLVFGACLGSDPRRDFAAIPRVAGPVACGPRGGGSCARPVG